MHVPYWVEPAAVADYGKGKWRDLDKVAETRYVNQVSNECELEHERRNRIVNEAQGFFFTDQTKMEQARRMEMRSCRRLNELGYRRG